MTHEIKLASGARFSLSAPSDIGLYDMLHHLALQPARAGATLRPLWMPHRAAMLSELAERAAKEEWDGWRQERSPHWRLVHQAALYGFLWRDAAALLGDAPFEEDEAMRNFRFGFVRIRCERYKLPWPPPAAIVQMIERCDQVIEALIDRELGTGAADYGDFPVGLRTPDAERAQRIYARRFSLLTNPAPDFCQHWMTDRDFATHWLRSHSGADYDVWGVPASGSVTLPVHRQDMEKLGDWLAANVLRPRRLDAAQ